MTGRTGLTSLHPQAEAEQRDSRWQAAGALTVRLWCGKSGCTVVSLRRDGRQIDVTRAEWDDLLARYAPGDAR